MMQDSYANCFLVAMPTLSDPVFSQAVVYVCQHDTDGAMGLIVNKPTHIDLRNMLKQLHITCDCPDILKSPVLLGGPMGQECGFVLLQETESDRIEVSLSKELLKDLVEKKEKNFLVAVGYSGWKKGQLEKEIDSYDWLVVPAHPDIVFNKRTKDRWLAAARTIGVDMRFMMSCVGHV